MLYKRILSFNNALKLDTEILPDGVDVLNPFQGAEADVVNAITHDFYKKYYNDNQNRYIIFGINPGRLGAGLTGVPFTDTERLEKNCEISARGIQTRETSAVFIYEMIEAFGGTQAFYQHFFIGAVSPLGFVKRNNKGRWVNYNYYDDKKMIAIMKPIIEQWFLQQYQLGMQSKVAFCLGTGKNFEFIQKLNNEMGLFQSIIPLEHPRYIMQYRNKQKSMYIQKFVDVLKQEITG